MDFILADLNNEYIRFTFDDKECLIDTYYLS